MASPTVNRTVLQQHPEPIRVAYNRVLRADSPSERHARTSDMLEVTLAHFASVAFSDYRRRSWRDSDPRIESVIARRRKLSVGHYLELLRSCAGTGDPSIVAACVAVDASELGQVARFSAIVSGIEDAVDLEAGNLERVVALRLEKSAAGLKWMEAWDLLVSYRNRSDGHATAHRWPVEHTSYYELTSEGYLAALVDLLSAEPVTALFRDYPLARLERIVYEEGTYRHLLSGEEAGVPFRTVVSMEKSIEDIFTADEWPVAVGMDILLSVTHSGGYEMQGPFHSLLDRGAPPSISPQDRTPSPVPLQPPSVSTTAWRNASASAPGTCGELVQGVTGDGRHFHVTCPIRKSSTVTARIRAGSVTTVEGARGRSKMDAAAMRTLEVLDLGPHEIVLDHWSDLDVGKGMGSSTADIAATVMAVASAAETQVTPEQIAEIATSIESSDGLMFPGINAVEQKTGRLVAAYEWFPQFAIAMVVPAAVFNTESADFRGKDKHGADFDRILADLEMAARRREADAFAEAATRSAELNQRHLVNPYFVMLRPKIRQYRADGLVVGHTGTVAGLLFAVDDDSMEAAVAASLDLQSVLPRDVRVEVTLTPPSPET